MKAAYLFSALMLLPVCAQAQQSEPLTIGTKLVVLDVVVTDAKGHLVDDLTAKDFQVFEDGKLQRVRSVDPPSAHILPAASASDAPAAAAYDPAEPARFGSTPVNILVLDQVNTHFADSSFARRALATYLAAQPALLPQPTALLEVVDSGFHQLAGFTRSRDALAKALAASPTHYAWQLEVNGKADHGPLDRLQKCLEALEQMSQSFARIPGRKTIIWTGVGFPTVDPAVLSTADAREIHETLAHITNLMLQTRMTLNAVDPSSTAPGMTEITDGTQMAFVTAVGDASGSADPYSATEDFDNLATATGGRVVRARNDITAQIAATVDQGANYYTVAYAPDSTSNAAAAYRNIRVVSIRPGLTVVTRSGYFTGKGTTALDPIAAATFDLTTAAESPIPLNALAVTATSESSDTFEIRVASSGLSWHTEADGSQTANVAILAAALNNKGKMVSHVLHSMSATARPDIDVHAPGRTATFHLPAALPAKAGKLRFVVRDSQSGAMGTFDMPAAARQ